MTRAVIVAGLVCFLIGFAVPGFAQVTAQPRRSVLQAVPGLGKPVTYTETKVPLGELVRRVAEDTGTRLTASRDVADEPVAVVVKELPARELLVNLAELLDYHWSRYGREGAWRYEIWQDLASKHREEALREALSAEAEKRLQQEVGRAAEIAALSPQQLQSLLEQARQNRLNLLKSPPPPPHSVAEAIRQRERSHRHNLAERLESPIARTIAVFLGRLSPARWALLREEGSLVFSTNPGPNEIRLPDEFVQSFRATSPQMSSSEAQTILPPELGGGPIGLSDRFRRREREMQERWSAATGYRLSIQLQGNPYQQGSRMDLLSTVTPTGGTAPASSSRIQGGSGTALNLHSAPTDLTVEDEVAENTAERRAALESDPVFGARKQFQPTVKPVALPYAQVWRLTELLPDLANSFGVQFISNSYWGTPAEALGFSPASSEPKPLYLLLERYGGLGYRWDRRGKLIRLRSRKWFLERPGEVPLRLLRRWKAVGMEHGALPLKEYVEQVALLNDGQVASLNSLVQPWGLPQDLRSIYISRYALRLYAALTPVQQRELWQGKALPVAQMPPAQRALFLASLQVRHRSGPLLLILDVKALDLTNLARGSLSLTSAQEFRVVEQHGDATGRPRSNLRAPAKEEGSATRHPVTRILFHLDYGAAEQETNSITVASPP